MAWEKILDEVYPEFGQIPPDANLKPLACAVINKAVDDLKSGHGRDFHDAKAFLCNTNTVLEFWCSISGMNMQAVVDRSRKLVKVPRPVTRLVLSTDVPVEASLPL